MKLFIKNIYSNAVQNIRGGLIASIFVMLVSVAMLSCDEDKFLDVYPLTQLSEGNFYNNLQEMQQGVDDVYRHLGYLANAQNVADLYGELFSDNTFIAFQLGGNPVDDPISRHEILSSNGRILNAWDESYNSIFICNNILEKIENTDIEIEQGLRSRWISEALVVRSFAYFNLVRAFGAIPLVTSTISPSQSYDFLRDDPAVVYEQLITDLTFAKNNLPEQYSGENVGRINRFGASAILAKIHLTMGNNSAAQTELEAIINSGLFSLDANNDGMTNTDDFLHLFAPSTKNCKASVLEAQYLAGPNAFNSNHQFAYSPYHHAFNLSGINASFRGGGVNTPTEDLDQEFEENDPRKEVSIRPGYINQATGEFVSYPHTLKFYDPEWQN
ncbi:MAG: RagB/SusD family nutrient uptake outer membrane protein, partial [Cyclobacteriaceae bacterium]